MPSSTRLRPKDHPSPRLQPLPPLPPPLPRPPLPPLHNRPVTREHAHPGLPRLLIVNGEIAMLLLLACTGGCVADRATGHRQDDLLQEQAPRPRMGQPGHTQDAAEVHGPCQVCSCVHEMCVVVQRREPIVKMSAQWHVQDKSRIRKFSGDRRDQ